MEYGYHHSRHLQQGDEIRTFQEKLNTIRQVYHGTWDRLQPDGIYGRRTRDAVRAFQTYMGLSPTGNMDMMTQTAITSKHQESQQTYSFFQPVQNFQATTALFTSAGDIDWSDYAAAGDTVVANLTASPSTYAILTKNKFVDLWKGPFNTYLSDLDTIADSFIEYKKVEFSMIINKLKPTIDAIRKQANEMGRALMKAVNSGIVKLSDLENAVKTSGELKAAEEMQKINAQKLSNAKAAGKIAKGFGFAAIVSQFLVVIYYGIAYFVATPAEVEDARKEFVNALGSFFGALLASALGKILQIIATRIAVGFAAGSVAPGAGNLVGTIVGIATAVLDIVLYLATGKTIGDRIWESIKDVFTTVSFKAINKWETLDYTKMSPAQIAYLGPGGVTMSCKF